MEEVIVELGVAGSRWVRAFRLPIAVPSIELQVSKEPEVIVLLSTASVRVAGERIVVEARGLLVGGRDLKALGLAAEAEWVLTTNKWAKLE